MRKTEILKKKGDWIEVVNDCRATVGKGELGKEPSDTFKTQILIAEHSPIRDISFKWRWQNIKSWVATHWVRHKWECFVRTQRTDRTGVNRDNLPQSARVDFTGEANVQHLIDTMRKRLCYQAAKETREYAEDLVEAISETDFAIGSVLVPNCIYRGGCPEMKSCGLWERFQNYTQNYVGYTDDDIQVRYEVYKAFVEENK